MKKRLVILGPPGAGKDTQGKMLGKALNIPVISSGDLVRKEINEKTDFGLRFKELTESGNLVPDDFMNDFFAHALSNYNLKDGYILNGFPRTINQAEFLDRYLKERDAIIDLVLFLDVDFDTLVKRLSGRRICKNCGSVYNIYFSPPKVDNICDICGSELIQREDDKVDAVKNRIEVYLKSTKPLLDFYEKKGILKSCDANNSPEKVNKDLIEVVNDCN
ncbi:adenylate kinase [Caldisericum exile]|uniref:Adenylate kinase n=1 Tax=Caldisericum exile (strain DSM 21853 / NBRC 104410 / AZM16c01) TaxID=511051 RepID=A0A7U6JH24_CALEA|nr:adenylate kinase [Caldisericum exile]BAL81247.1 adenylate kinase [Caldisericum exile AZM16c01]